LSSYMNLFLKNDNTIDTLRNNTNVDLFILGPSGINDNVDLYIRGDGITDDTIPSNGNMTLFMARDSESIEKSMPLYIATYEQIGDINTYIYGHGVANSPAVDFEYRNFYGTSVSFELTSGSLRTDSDSFSIDFWYYPLLFNNYSIPITNEGSATAAGWGLYIDDAGQIIMGYNDGSYSTYSFNAASQKLILFEWQHIVLSADRTNHLLHMYKNGIYVGFKDTSARSGALSSDVSRIGAYGIKGATYKTYGGLCRIKFALGYLYTQDDATESYNKNYGKLYSELSSTLQSNLSYAWDMTESGDTLYDSISTNHALRTGLGDIPYKLYSRYCPLYISGSGEGPSKTLDLYTHGF